MRVLYITFDGLLEPLGASQVVAPLLGLAERGFKYSVVSLEKAADLADEARIATLRHRLTSAGVDWHPIRYETGGARSVARNLRVATETVLKLATDGRHELLHARAHLPALVARVAKARLGLPYVFDFRGYWVDERREEKRWIVNDSLLQLGHAVESHLLRESDAVVCLTDLARDELRSRVRSGVDVRTITTVADYDVFGRVARAERDPIFVDKLVVGYVGSINVSYALDESLDFFCKLRERRSDAHLLCLTRQIDEMRAALEARQVPASACTVVSASHDEMPMWWAQVDWGLLFLKSPRAKQGSMPTKLAEMFAAGVRPVQFGCNSEVAAWVRHAGSGIVLDELSNATLRHAAERVAAFSPQPGDLEQARRATESHFGLRGGVEAYAELLSRARRR